MTVTHQRRDAIHRMVVKRQNGLPIPGVPGGGDNDNGDDNETPDNGGGDDGGNDGPSQPAPSQPQPSQPSPSQPAPSQPPPSPSQPPVSPSQPPPSPSQPPSTPPTQPTPSREEPEPTPSSTPTSSSPSSTTPSSTRSSTESSTRSPSSSARATSTTPRATTTNTNNIAGNRSPTSSFYRASGVSLIPTASSIDPTSSTEPTGGISTGAVVGGIAGALVGLALLGGIVSFLLRKWRNRRRDDDEDFGTDFRRSAFVQDSRPESMTQTGGFASSIAGAGVAGQGAYGQYSDKEQVAYDISGNDVVPVAQTTGYGATDHSAHHGGGLQERPKYVYGQADPHSQHDDDVSEHAHGVYSSQPQMQTAYNPEAYGSYAAYDNTAGYQQPTREYQGQQGYTDNTGYGAQGYGYDQTAYGNNNYAQGYDASQYPQYDQQGQQQYDQQGQQQYDQQGQQQYAQYDASAYAVTSDTTAPAGAAPAAATATAMTGAATTTAGAHKTQPSLGKNTEDAYGEWSPRSLLSYVVDAFDVLEAFVPP
ncbi:hypothetical protein CC2G_012030 [Coprinopsis cinerea AmutBmut pab1-1]|nr:hypothetical protein CC2G_012030 [Coprinopsis cinerea AmutBmut pab1-1]